MPGSRPPLRRIQVIDQQIRGQIYPNALSIAVALEVSSRTAQRDFEFLRDQLGAPLEFCRRKNGYFYRHASFRLPTFQFTEGELISFFLAERLLKQYRGTPYEHDLQRAFGRIVQALWAGHYAGAAPVCLTGCSCAMDDDGRPIHGRHYQLSRSCAATHPAVPGPL